jgi:hypothetical protein
METPDDPVTKAAEYKHDDGSVEIVLAEEDGRVLTLREYPDEATFDAATGSAAYVGQHDGVEELPDVEAFQDPE